MHEFVEDVEEVEVIADDFLIAGFGSTDCNVNQSLERNEGAFLEKCRLWNLKLNHAVEPWSETAPVKCEIRGSSPHFSGANARSWEDSGHIADALTWRCYSIEAIPGDGDVSRKVNAPPITDERAT